MANFECEKLPGDASTPLSTPADQYADHALQPLLDVDRLGIISNAVKKALMQ
jgi:phage gp46-like protein